MRYYETYLDRNHGTMCTILLVIDASKMSVGPTTTAAAAAATALDRVLPDLMADVLPFGLGPADLGDEEAPAGLHEDVDEVLRAVDALHATAAGVEQLGAAGARQREGLGFEGAPTEACHGVYVEEVALEAQLLEPVVVAYEGALVAFVGQLDGVVTVMVMVIIVMVIMVLAARGAHFIVMVAHSHDVVIFAGQIHWGAAPRAMMMMRMMIEQRTMQTTSAKALVLHCKTLGASRSRRGKKHDPETPSG